MTEPLHRDDLPFELAEEITKKLKELHPGSRVQFVGDSPPEDDGRKAAERLDQLMRETYSRGECMECEAKYPASWPPGRGDPLLDGWVRYCEIATKKPVGIVCPDCDRAYQDLGG